MRLQCKPVSLKLETVTSEYRESQHSRQKPATTNLHGNARGDRETGIGIDQVMEATRTSRREKTSRGTQSVEPPDILTVIQQLLTTNTGDKFP